VDQIVFKPSNNNKTPSKTKPFIPTVTVADLLLRYLEQLSVKYVFGVPGGAIEPLFDAFARCQDQENSPKIIVARHESGAAFMADGYHHITGNLGVCVATTGPGVTNMITGIATAQANKIPLLVISAQTALPTFGRNAVQESSCTGVDTVAMLKHCCRFSSLVSHPEQFEYKLITAIMRAFGPTPGAVHLSIPMDVLRSAVEFSTPRYQLDKLIQRHINPDLDTIEHLFDLLTNGDRSVFIIGDGCGPAIAGILTVACSLNIDIVCTPHGKGLVNAQHPMFRGVLGFAGHDDALDAVTHAEVNNIFCLGTLMGEWASNGWDDEVISTEKCIHIDEIEEHFSSTPKARQHIYANLATTFHLLTERISTENIKNPNSDKNIEIINQHELFTLQRQFALDDEEGYCSDSTPIKPQRLMRELPKIFPSNTHYLADCGNSFAWAIHYLQPSDRRIFGVREDRASLFRACLEFAPMGWAIGCAVGASIAKRNQQIVCITGDGSFLMSGQELSVAVQENLSIVFIVLNDSALGMVKHGQRLTGGEPIAFEMPPTNFVELAHSLGAKAFKINSPQDLTNLSEELNRKDGPILLDVYIDPEEVPPIAKRVAMLTKAS